MISRLLSSRLTSPANSALRKASLQNVALRQQRSSTSPLTTLTRTRLSRPQSHSLRRWPLNSNSIHNLPAVRHASFARAIPQLALKLVRVPAMFGIAMIGGVTYLQYQAGLAGTWAIDTLGKARDAVSGGASEALTGAEGIWAQMSKGWSKTRDDVGTIAEGAQGRIQLPAWMRDIYEGRSSDGSDSGEGGGGGPNEPKRSSIGAGAAGAATVGAFALDAEGQEDDRSELTAAKDDQMMLLTRKMIEIRSLLQTIGQGSALTLPSIVVIGSQSSGKSSVLEAIVGHEFLPKGSNMVTRRPIELTLVNTPDASASYGEFPSLGLGKITDFTQIQKTLTDLNLAVPEKDCVSDDPIQLRISSPHVPDLSLIDLPGYIQVEAFDQPTELKGKIQDLCEKYIQPPNVILAISAADVDLANSTALRASRRVDPRGERTIGVITKMDLVEPERGRGMLADKNYPLRLGYVGVVCRIPQESRSLFKRGGKDVLNAISKNESVYFSSHPSSFGRESGVQTGTPNLRKKLIKVLETTMSAALATTSEKVQRELAETTYEFKVQYNERPLSAESYLAESLDAFKHAFKGFGDTFGRKEVRELVKAELDQQVLNLLAGRYWNKPVERLALDVEDPVVESLEKLPKIKETDPAMDLWKLKLDASTSTLTKLGIGRLATSITAQALQDSVQDLVQNSPFSTHPFAINAIASASESILRDLSWETADELEICVKPYKYRVEVTEQDWKRGRDNISDVLSRELKAVEEANRGIEDQIGGRKRAKEVVSFIDRVRRGDVVLEGDGAGGAGGFSAKLLEKGKEALFLRDRADILQLRLKAIKSRPCGYPSNKVVCPEIFLDAVASQLTTTADLFLDAELLSKFFYQFPRRLESEFRALDEGTVERFAREDPKIARHLEVVRKKERLEEVVREMEGLRGLERRERGRSEAATSGQRRKGWFS